MRASRQAIVVAAWEFRRYFKWKDQAIGLGFFLLVSILAFGASIVGGTKGRTVTVALAGIDVEAPAHGRLRFVTAPEDGPLRLAALRSGDVAGVLVRRPDGGYELTVEKDPRYLVELEAVLEEISRREKLRDAGLSEEDLERILQSTDVAVRFVDPEKERRGLAEKIAAGVFIVILLMAIFTSMAYLLTGITGEKQLRVTEAVVSAITPQAWIDGKILGIAAYSVVSVGNLVVGGLVLALAARLGTGFSLPSAAVRPGVLLALALFSVLGLLLWNAFFAAVASTIDDPNTSARSSLLFLPLLPVLMSLAVLRDPDSPLSIGLAVFPLTSAPALPIRLVLSDPGLLEIAAAVALLIVAIAFFRRLAGRIFEIGILLYGKEPTLPEIARWASARTSPRK